MNIQSLRLIVLHGALLSTILQTGCGSISKVISDYDKAEKVRDKFLYSDADTIARRLFDPNSDQHTGLELARQNYNAAMNTYYNAEPNDRPHKLQAAKALRDDLIYELITISDFVFNAEKDQLFKGRGSLDTGYKIVDLALTGTAAAFGSASTKSALSAAATFLSGSKGAIDENFYAKQTVSSLVSTMEGKRADKLELLLKQLRLPPTEYGLSSAIQGVRDLHRAGSLVDAVISLNQDAAKLAAEKQLKLQNTNEEIIKAYTAAASPPAN